MTIVTVQTRKKISPDLKLILPQISISRIGDKDKALNRSHVIIHVAGPAGSNFLHLSPQIIWRIKHMSEIKANVQMIVYLEFIN